MSALPLPFLALLCLGGLLRDQGAVGNQLQEVGSLFALRWLYCQWTKLKKNPVLDVPVL